MSERRWNEERFLNVACAQIAKDADWDSLDSGRLHSSCTYAKTLNGSPLIIGVLDKPEMLQYLYADAEAEKRNSKFPPDTPIWLYVPRGLELPSPVPEYILVKEIEQP